MNVFLNNCCPFVLALGALQYQLVLNVWVRCWVIALHRVTLECIDLWPANKVFIVKTTCTYGISLADPDIDNIMYRLCDFYRHMWYSIVVHKRSSQPALNHVY